MNPTRYLALALLPLSLALHAAEPAALSQLSQLGLKYADAQGCSIGDGTFTASTLPFLAAAYNQPGIAPATVLELIGQAIANGCPLAATDDMGLSALNAAILYNELELVRLLLERGADPRLAIASQKPALDGLDSFGWLAYLEQNDRRTDRTAIRGLLAGR